MKERFVSLSWRGGNPVPWWKLRRRRETEKWLRKTESIIDAEMRKYVKEIMFGVPGDGPSEKIPGLRDWRHARAKKE